MLALVAAAGVTLAAHAQADADPRLGERIAAQGGGDGVTACNVCHGDRGQGDARLGFPPLSGQPIDALRRALDDYASGARPHPLMGSIARAMTPRQCAATAAWYASLPPPVPTAR